MVRAKYTISLTHPIGVQLAVSTFSLSSCIARNFQIPLDFSFLRRARPLRLLSQNRHSLTRYGLPDERLATCLNDIDDVFDISLERTDALDEIYGQDSIFNIQYLRFPHIP